jgi:hypothetical protein
MMRGGWVLTIAALATVASLTGCAPFVQIETRVDNAYVGTVDRIYAISNLSALTVRFGNSFAASLPAELAKVGVECQVFTFDPLALDDRPPLGRAQAFSPRAVLVLEPTEKGGPLNRFVSVAHIDAKLRDLERDVVYWRASIRVESDTGGHTPLGETSAQDLARVLVRRLTEDGVLRRAAT